MFTVLISSPTSVDIRSVGYAGDPNSDVGVITSGGFDTNLTLFGPTGSFIAENDDGENAQIDPTTGQGFDAEIVQDLMPGIYALVLTQGGNYALGQNISSGFSESGNSSYTNDPGSPGDMCPGGMFKDVSGSTGRCRNGRYAIEFLNDQGGSAYYSLLDSPPFPRSPIPEPGSLALLCVTVIVSVFIVITRRGVPAVLERPRAAGDQACQCR